MKRRVLTGAALGVVFLSVSLLLIGLREVGRGQDALERSNRAFHAGQLLLAVHEARAAALCYVPGAAHVKQAEERMEAIAKGAEADGNPALARRAWDALRLVDEETDYPGRAPSPSGDRARAALRRLDQAAAQHF